jgi:hypothetical protein
MAGPRFTLRKRTAAILATLLLAGALATATIILSLRVTLTAPPAPVILSGPTNPTSSTSATFTFTDSTAGVAFQCSLDGGAYSACASGKSYGGLEDGKHTFRVTATNGSSPASKPASYDWVVETQTGEGQLGFPGTTNPAPSTNHGRPPAPPPAPVITEGPDNPTSATDAEIEYRDSQRGVTLLCSIDGSVFATCPDVEQDGDADYNNLAPGAHTFQVVAVDASGNRSAPATFTWTVVITGRFPISGNITGLFAPGVTQPLDLSFTNPFGFELKVLSVTITVQHGTTQSGQPNPGCDGPTNLVVVQGSGGPVTVPGHSTRSLQALGVPQAQWPQIEMPDLTTNQDACKSTTFTLSYTGTATKG